MGEICCAFSGALDISPIFFRGNTRYAQRVVCLAAPGSKAREQKSFKKEKTMKHNKTYVDEEIYNISHGWKIKVDEDEKARELAGLSFPASLNTPDERVKAPAPTEEPRKVHKLLRIMGGRNAGKKLLSPDDMSVRPMMEVVRGAIFNILQARGRYIGLLPPGRWLDLYCGTGSVGIEALSRGCSSAHFIELDPWVISQVLKPNLEATNFMDQSTIHMMRVETYLDLQAKNPRAEPFDYISVTPPYEAVHYPTLMAQLSKSPLVGEFTFVVVEYPLKSKNEMPETCGPVSAWFTSRRFRFEASFILRSVFGNRRSQQAWARNCALRFPRLAQNFPIRAVVRLKILLR